jgi:hypothetical protein
LGYTRNFQRSIDGKLFLYYARNFNTIFLTKTKSLEGIGVSRRNQERRRIMRRYGFPVFSTILYILGAFVLIYALWAAYVSYDIISSAIEQGQLVFRGNQFEIMSFIMSNFGQFLIFAVILLALGRLLQIYPEREDDYYDEEEEVESSVLVVEEKPAAPEKETDEWVEKSEK